MKLKQPQESDIQQYVLPQYNLLIPPITKRKFVKIRKKEVCLDELEQDCNNEVMEQTTE